MRDQKTRHASRRGPRARQAFTLVEAIVALGVLGPVIAAALGGMIYAATRADTINRQIRYAAQTRTLAQRFTRMVESSRLISMDAGDLLLHDINGGMRRLALVDGNDPTAVGTSQLVLFPDAMADLDGGTLATHITPIPGTPLLEIVSTSPLTVALSAHVGDSAAFRQTRHNRSRQGVELRISATPRNVQRTYERVN